MIKFNDANGKNIKKTQSTLDTNSWSFIQNIKNFSLWINKNKLNV